MAVYAGGKNEAVEEVELYSRSDSFSQSYVGDVFATMLLLDDTC